MVPGVVTEFRTLDIAELASILLSEYYEGSPLRRAVDLSAALQGQRDLDAGEPAFVVDVQAGGSSLRGLVATLDAVQLAVDAATAAVFYDRELSNHITQDIDYRFLRDTVNDAYVTLEIVELANGSFKTRVKAFFKSPVTYATAVAVAVVATAAINILFPPLIVPSLVVGGIVAAGGIPAAIHAQRERKKSRQEIGDLKGAVSELKGEVGELKGEVGELRGALRRLDQRSALLREAPRKIVDTGALAEAEIQSIEIDSAPPLAA